LKNPLKPIFIFFSIITSINIFLIIIKIIEGSTLVAVIESRMVGIASLCLYILFIVCYLQKKVFAWWIALTKIPIMFVYSHIIKNRPFDEKSIFTFIVVLGALD